VPDRPARPGTFAHLAQRAASGGSRPAKDKSNRCGQCEERPAHVV